MLRFAQHDKLVDACALFSMTNWWMLHFVQHDRPMSLRTLFFVIANTLFCHSERSEESSAWMLCFAQHDKLVDACASLSMTNWWMLALCSA